MTLPKILLHKGKERSLLHFHPWLFSGAVKGVNREPEEGEMVEIFSSENKYLATGHFHNGSICVKIFSFTQVNPDYGYWKQKIKKAFEIRSELGFLDNPGSDSFRLVHGEGDGLPGLIIDYYNGVAVMQTHTTGMYLLRNFFADALKEIFGKSLQAIYDKSSETLSKHGSPMVKNEYLYRSDSFSSENSQIKENGLKFFVNWEEGQKTAFFLDQRDNRALVKKYSSGKKVLNTFAYSGAFSVYALAGGARLVHSVDSSVKASAWCGKNISENFPGASHTFFTKDVFEFFKSNEENYDLLILDPPAFAKHLSSVKKACYGYQNLNETAIRKINPGGIIFTFSCSQVIDKKLFRQVVFAAAAAAGRQVTVLHQLSQPPDHPISIFHPEGEYLKGLVLRVD